MYSESTTLGGAPPPAFPALRLLLRWRAALGLSLLVLLALGVACTSVRAPSPTVLERGYASWYGGKFQGRKTASGETFDTHRLTAAHKTLPFGTLVEVRNLDNDKTVTVRINDRGPFVRGRVIDLSYAAARQIGVVGPGTAKVELALVAEPERAAEAMRARPFYTVQLGAFVERDRAAELSSELAPSYPAVAVRTDGTWHRVQVGEFAHRRAAERLRRELADLGFTALVVTVF